MIDFDKLKGKVAVHLPTQEQFNEFLKECDKKGITWGSGEKATNNQSYWSVFKEMTSVCICDKSYIVCGTIDNFTFFHYTILEYSDVCNSDLPRVCYILGGEDSPLQIDEEFQVIGDNGIYYIDQNGHFIDEFECGNEHGLCDAINHPENVIRNPMNKQFTDEQKSLLKSLLANVDKLHNSDVIEQQLAEADSIYQQAREEIEQRYKFSGVTWAAIDFLLKAYGNVVLAENRARKAGIDPKTARLKRMQSNNYSDNSVVEI